MDKLIKRYGTATISLMLLHLAKKVRDQGSDLDIAIIEDMAYDLGMGLIEFNQNRPANVGGQYDPR